MLVSKSGSSLLFTEMGEFLLPLLPCEDEGRVEYLHRQLPLGVLGSLQVKSQFFLLDHMLTTHKRHR